MHDMKGWFYGQSKSNRTLMYVAAYILIFAAGIDIGRTLAHL